MKSFHLCASLWLLAACASTTSGNAPATAPGSPTLKDLSEQRALAPQAAAHADQLQKAAEALRAEENPAEASLVQERALVAYRRLEIQARAVSAAQREAVARATLSQRKATLSELERRQEQTEAETRSLELRIQVARDAEARVPLEASSPKRDAARLRTAKAVGSEAALLCEAARLLDPKRPSLVQALQQSREVLDASTRVSPPTLLNRALDARSRCLKELTEIRRTEGAPGAGESADQWLERLARAFPKALVFRDDRGVVLSARPFASGDKLSPEGSALIQDLAEVAHSNPEVPLFVVTHGLASKAGSVSPSVDDRRAQSLRSALTAAGLPDIPLHIGARYAATPVLKPSAAQERNDFIEFIFVLRQS